MKIKNKEQMYELLKAGKLGNTFRTWPSIEDAIKDGYCGLFGMRTSIRGGPMFNGDMNLESAFKAQDYCMSMNPEFIIVYEEVPSQDVTMNCEIQRNSKGLYIRYAYGPAHMREAMSKSIHRFGINAQRIIQHLAGEGGWLHCCELMEEYQDTDLQESAVIEMSTFSKSVGSEQKEYIIWEVRNY